MKIAGLQDRYGFPPDVLCSFCYIESMRRAEAIERLRQHRAQLSALGVTHAYLFGSVANDVATPESDIDVMVDLDEGPSGRKPLFSAFDVGGI